MLGVPPYEKWRREGDAVNKIALALRLNINQHRRILDVIVKTHYALLTGVGYDSMREFRAGSIANKPDSPEEQTDTD